MRTIPRTEADAVKASRRTEFTQETEKLLAKILADCPELVRAERARQGRIRRRLREVWPLLRDDVR